MACAETAWEHGPARRGSHPFKGNKIIRIIAGTPRSGTTLLWSILNSVIDGEMPLEPLMGGGRYLGENAKEGPFSESFIQELVPWHIDKVRPVTGVLSPDLEAEYYEYFRRYIADGYGNGEGVAGAKTVRHPAYLAEAFRRRFSDDLRVLASQRPTRPMPRYTYDARRITPPSPRVSPRLTVAVRP